MADFEDANSPTWSNQVEGQANLVDAVEGTITYDSSDGRHYALRDDTADPAGPPARLAPAGEAPAWPSRRAGRPARWSTSGCTRSTTRAGCSTAARRRTSTCPRWSTTSRPGCGTRCSCSPRRRWACRTARFRATVLIETLPAAFQMEEILFELRDHSYGLNAGRWDYIFSMIKSYRDDPAFVLPDRTDVTMTAPFMRAYTELLVATCHRRGAFAMGGMAALIPSRTDAGGQRARGRRGPGRQAARGRRRLRRHLGRPPRPGRRSRRPSSTRCSATGPNQIDRQRDDVVGQRRRTARRRRRRRARSPRPGCATTSASASATSRSGSPAAAPPASTT